MRYAFIFGLSLLAMSAGAATMYKWVDEKGVTHFSEEPPPDGKAQKLDVKPVPPSATVKEPPLEELRRREIDLRQQRQDKERREEKSGKDTAQRMARCRSAQRDLDVLQRQRPVYSINERGERVYIEDKQRGAEVEAARKAVDAYCGS